jgi:hypothetical protein
MKAIVSYNENSRKIEIHGHDLEDEQADRSLKELLSEGREAYTIDQPRPHGGKAERCIKCKSSAAKLFSGIPSEEPFARTELETPSISIGSGMVSQTITDIREPEVKTQSVKSLIIRILGVCIVLGVIFGLSFMAIKLRSNNKAILANKATASPTASTPIITSFTSPTPTPLIPTSTEPIPTAALTFTPVKTMTEIPTLTATPTNLPVIETPNCIEALSVTIDDVGKVLCVFGTIIRNYTQGDAWYIVFSDERGKFYMVAYAPRDDANVGTCVQIKKRIQRLGPSPVIVLDTNDKLSPCSNTP